MSYWCQTRRSLSTTPFLPFFIFLLILVVTFAIFVTFLSGPPSSFVLLLVFLNYSCLIILLFSRSFPYILTPPRPFMLLLFSFFYITPSCSLLSLFLQFPAFKFCPPSESPAPSSFICACLHPNNTSFTYTTRYNTRAIKMTQASVPNGQSSAAAPSQPLDFKVIGMNSGTSMVSQLKRSTKTGLQS